ncbi:MAG: trypsin-like peptidase domain-containing protein [Candidatus Obscuribacterales bacterium]|nr:trypsin-like peptidase domain-containing protein [Candidatus Obscuribacterales bacterium]
MAERFSNSKHEGQKIPVLLPNMECLETYALEFPPTSQTAQNYRKAQGAVVHVDLDSIDLKESAKRGLIDKELAKELAKEPNREELKTSATGFFITDDGWLVTNFHVANVPAKVSAEWPGGSKVQLRKVYQDAKVDLAIFKIDSADFNSVPYLPLAKTDSLSPEERLTTIGYPNCWKDLHCSPGNLLGLGKRGFYLPDAAALKLRGLSRDLEIMQTNCQGAPGGSGSPLLNLAGEVVGVTFAGTTPDNKTTLSYAISVKQVRDAARHVPELRKKLGL